VAAPEYLFLWALRMSSMALEQKTTRKILK
jgi:hypothetical protein